MIPYTFVTLLLAVALGILAILLASAYALTASRRAARLLKGEVEAKVGELKQSQDRLQTAYAFLQSVVDGVAEPIMVIGTDYHITLMNRAAREFWSGPADSPEPPLCHVLSHQCATPCSGIEHPCPLEEVRRSGQPLTVVHEHYQASGERRFVEIVAAPLLGPDGAFRGIVEAARDITHRLTAEQKAGDEAQELARQGDQLGRFTHEITRSIKELLANMPTD